MGHSNSDIPSATLTMKAVEYSPALRKIKNHTPYIIKLCQPPFDMSTSVSASHPISPFGGLPKNVSYIDGRPNTPCSLGLAGSRHVTLLETEASGTRHTVVPYRLGC
jgi:hypothetical protein